MRRFKVYKNANIAKLLLKKLLKKKLYTIDNQYFIVLFKKHRTTKAKQVTIR